VSEASDEHPLLALQALDSAADGLVAERAGLSQRAAIGRCETDREGVEAEIEAVRTREAELTESERALEREVADSVREGREVEDKLYSGKVQGVSELEGLQTQLDSFRAKQAELEERQLELMESREALDEALVSLEEKRAGCDSRREDLLVSLAENEAAIDGQLTAFAARRQSAAECVAAVPLRTYDRLRKSPRLAGVVTAQVRSNACGRCRIPVPVMRLTRVRQDAPDDVVPCENCNRILLP